MSGENKTVVSVKDLVVCVINDEKTGGEYRFKIDYGTFDINLGDFVLLKGRNGCGKSTFLRLFHLQGVDYFKVGGGCIKFNEDGFSDKSIHEYSRDELTLLNRKISYIGQDERFQTSDSAYSFIYNSCRYALESSRKLSSMDRKELLKSVDGVIYEYYEKYLSSSFKCSYATFKRKNVRAWSGGQQKMINVLAGIIKAKLCGLKLVVMDEPLNNLDGRNKFILNNLIADLRKQDVAVLAITHCQIFDGVNKVLNLVEQPDGTRKATLSDCAVPAHEECLEAYQEGE